MKKLLLVVIPFFVAACALSRDSVEVTPSSTRHSFSFTFTPMATLAASPAVTDTPIKVIYRATSMPTPTPNPTLEPGQPILLSTLNMMGATTGWAIESNNHLLRTIDGGNTWQDVTPPGSDLFSFLDPTHAWAVVKTQVPCNVSGCQWQSALVTWQTSDGGQTWQRGLPFATGAPENQPIALQFTDDRSGWLLFVDQIGMSASTYESLLQTNDGGKTWAPGQGRISSGCISGGMVVLNEQDGWIGNDCRWSGALEGTRLQDFLDGQDAPALLQTSDGGKSWVSSLDYPPLPPPKIFPTSLTSSNADPDTEIRCGVTRMERISQTAFTLQWTCSDSFPYWPTEITFSYDYLTSDNGQNWHTWLATGNESFVNATTGWRLFLPGEGQSNQLQQTSDGGLSWTNLKTVAWQSAQFNFVSEQVGWAIISEGTDTALIHTTDGGKTWALLKPTVVP